MARKLLETEVAKSEAEKLNRTGGVSIDRKEKSKGGRCCGCRGTFCAPCTQAC